jgi:Icc-related predicted phosphoesterase
VNKNIRKVREEEILLEKISEIIVIGDPGCTGFNDDSKRIFGGILSQKAGAFIVLGDIVHRGNMDELNEFVSFCDTTAKVPVFTLCGNHDLPEYATLLGSSTYSLITGELVFILVDNVSDWEHFSKKELEFIRQQLEKHSGKRLILLFHVPPPTDLAPKHMKDQKWGELKAVLDAHKDRIECLICGHIHGFQDYVVDGYRVLITGGGGAKLDDLENDPVKAHHAIKINIDRSGPVSFEVVRV